LFDRGLLHDGRLNTYTFSNDHKKITCTSFKPSQIQKRKDSSQLDVFLTYVLIFEQHEFELTQVLILLNLEHETTPLPTHPLSQPFTA